MRERAGVKTDAEIPAAALRELCERYKAIVREASGKPFPQDPTPPAPRRDRGGVPLWNSPACRGVPQPGEITHDLGTAVNVQAMVFGNRDDNSGTGVGFTRNPPTGENRPYGDFLVNAQGEDVVAGIRDTDRLDAMGRRFPKIHTELLAIFDRLERHYRDMCDTEFTIEQGKLWMLQTRVGKRTGARRAAHGGRDDPRRVDQAHADEAVRRVTAEHLDQVLHPQFGEANLDVLTKGLAASPGAAVGKVYFDADHAVNARRERRARSSWCATRPRPTTCTA